MKLKYGIVGVIVLVIIIITWLFVRNYLTTRSQTPIVPESSSVLTEDQSTDELRQEIKKVIVSDADMDGLSNEEEQKYGTDKNNPDTDGDGLLDGDEINTYTSDPLKVDTDGDGILDGKAVRMRKNPKGGALSPSLESTSSLR